MKRAACLSVAMTLAACAHGPEPVPARAVVCSEGLANLSFIDGTNRLDSLSTRSLAWVAEVNRQCEVRSMTATGLPEPSNIGLAGQRATSVRRALQHLGIANPTWKLGDAEEQRSPALVIDAMPKR